MRATIPSVDLAWLHADRPNNLMYVHGVLALRERPDWDAMRDVIQERLVDRFPVFGRRAVEVDGTWVWEDDPEFSLDYHVHRVTLEPPGTKDEAQRYISDRLSEQFDPARPLWEIDLIDMADDTALVLARFHHGIADGVRLVQVLGFTRAALPTP